MRHIYLDYNATAPPRPEALDAMTECAAECFGNPSSTHHFGRESKRVLEKSRAKIAEFLGCRSDEIVFTAGGTSANNLALMGVVAGAPASHIVSTAIEHSSVLNVLARLERMGHSVSLVNPDSRGIVAPAEIDAAIRPDTALVAVMHSNNETGMIQPIAEVAEIAARRGVHLHVDCVQSLGKTDLDARALGADSLSFSSHKIGGPRGCGALILKRGRRLNPLIYGGGQERRLWPGTENVPAIAGFAKACEILKLRGEEEIRNVKRVAAYLERSLRKAIPSAVINNPGEPRIPNTLNVSFPGIEGDAMVVKLDLRGFAVSTGSACSSGKVGPSHVLKAMGLPLELQNSSIRISLGPGNTSEEMDALIEALLDITR